MFDNNIKEYIHKFLLGKLSVEKEEFLLSWIKKSEKNKILFFNEQERLHTELVTQKDHRLEMRWQTLLSEIHSVNTFQRTRKIVLKIASIAAAFILGVLITFWTTQNTTIDNNLITHNITTPFGAKTDFILPDGSKVWLNSGSSISYPSGFGETRSIELSGEAYFEVEKGNIPFIISTEYGKVEVKGTSFNVKAFQNEILETTLVTGLVSITGKDTGEEITLQPGQQADIINSNIIVKNVDTELFTSWKEGKLIFREEYLPSAVKRLERWYNVTIELDDDPRLSDIWYSGTIEMESFSEVLELLKLQHLFHITTTKIHVQLELFMIKTN